MNNRWTTFVALGDSLTEGVGDPGPDGRPRGWADRFAGELADRQGGLRYANLAVRGLTAAEVLDTQLSAARALRPELASVIVGMNDLIRPRVGMRGLFAGYDALLDGMLDTGAAVLTATLPDPLVLPLPGPVRKRFTARLHRFNSHIRSSARRRGALCLDLARLPAVDPAGFCDDRLHPSPYGHQTIADEFLVLLTGSHSGASEPRPAGGPAELVGVGPTLRWLVGVTGPWLVRRASGRQPTVTAKSTGYLLLGTT